MPKSDVRAIVNEAFKAALSEQVDEAFGMFNRRPQQPQGMSANDVSMRERHHRNMTVKHTELAHDFDRMGNREAGDFHTAAADAHSRAAKALQFHHQDPEGYRKAAEHADNASREANVFVKEDYSEMGYGEPSDHRDIHTAFRDIADRFKERQTATVNVPTSPNTMRFVSPARGMIQHLKNVQIAREHPFSPHRFDHFIQIGSNVDRDTANQIKGAVHDYLMDSGHVAVDYKGNPTGELGSINKDFIRTVDKDGNKHTVHLVHGTSWGGIGIKREQ